MEEDIKEILMLLRDRNHNLETANITLQNENRNLRQINETLLNIINNKMNG